MTDLDKLREAFREALFLDETADVDALEYRGIEQWDSLAHLTLVAKVEDTFDLMLTTDEVIDLSSFQVARRILASHGVDV